jgi:pimeloyl-ACP methyl ester carboxylesterase
MPTVDLPQGRIHYRVAGPADSSAPPVVFIHGLLVNSELWSGVGWSLAEHRVRSYALDLPLGSQPEPLAADADRSPRGVARLILDFLTALDLDDVTLVGNDTGGAVCQFVIDTDARRIGRLVLTNCDAFEQFPPPPFGALIKLGRRPALLRAVLRGSRFKAIRHSVLGYGGLVTNPLDPQLTARWVRPCLADRAIAVDVAGFLAGVKPAELLDVSTRFAEFGRPVLLVWGAADPFFKLTLGERLQAAFPDARLVSIDGGRAFVPLDHPQRVAEEIAAFADAGAAR